MQDERSSIAENLRIKLEMDVKSARILCQYLKCFNLASIVAYLRHNSKVKEFILFDKEELNYFKREKGVDSEKFKNLAKTILILAKESEN